MSVVIVGGHDRMVCQYKKICKQFKCKAKVFTHMSADLNKQLGQPDLFVLFTNTVSHKMVKTALDEAKRSNAKVVRSRSSSLKHEFIYRDHDPFLLERRWMWHLDRMQSGKAKRNEMNVSWYENYLGTFYMCPAWQI